MLCHLSGPFSRRPFCTKQLIGKWGDLNTQLLLGSDVITNTILPFTSRRSKVFLYVWVLFCSLGSWRLVSGTTLKWQDSEFSRIRCTVTWLSVLHQSLCFSETLSFPNAQCLGCYHAEAMMAITDWLFACENYLIHISIKKFRCTSMEQGFYSFQV